MRQNLVFVLADNQVFQIEAWSLILSLDLADLNVEPNVLINFELVDLLLVLDCMFAMSVFNDPKNDEFTRAISVHGCKLSLLSNHFI